MVDFDDVKWSCFVVVMCLVDFDDFLWFFFVFDCNDLLVLDYFVVVVDILGYVVVVGVYFGGFDFDSIVEWMFLFCGEYSGEFVLS